MPQEYGGAGLGMTEAALMMQTIAASGAGFAGASAVHMNIFGLNPVVVFGDDAQRRRWLPPLIAGREKACFAVTEPDAGLTPQAGHAGRAPGRRVRGPRPQDLDLDGPGGAQDAAAGAHHPAVGGGQAHPGPVAVLYGPDRSKVEVREIEKMGRKAVDSNMLFIDGLPIPVADRVGEEGRGFEYILHGLNPERILIAAEAVGIGRAALSARGALCRRARSVRPPDRPEPGRAASAGPGLDAAGSGRPDGIQGGQPVRRRQALRPRRELGQYLAAEAGYNACQTAVMTLGGMGYAKEYHVERLLRESFIPRIAPVSPQLILCFIAEKVLGLPKSY